MITYIANGSITIRWSVWSGHERWRLWGAKKMSGCRSDARVGECPTTTHGDPLVGQDERRGRSRGGTTTRPPTLEAESIAARGVTRPVT